MLIWKNHQFISVPDQATLAELIPQLSFFETFALRQGTVLMPEVHESRLFNALKYLALKSHYLHLDFSQKTKNWKPILEKLLSHEKLNDAIVRWVVVPTKGGLIEWVSVRPLPVTPPSFSLVVLETKRDNAEWLPRPKTGPWTNSQTAWNELKSYSDRTDIEGIQLDKNGYISDGTRSALVWWDGKDWFTPHDDTQKLFSTSVQILESYLKSHNQSLKYIKQGLPLAAQSILVLRSTLESGAVGVDKVITPQGEILWTASPEQTVAQQLIAHLKEFRAQRSVILL